MVDRDRASKSVLWSALENGGLSVVSFASLIIYSRLLSPVEFGMFAMALAVTELLGILSNMTFHDALVQREDVTNDDFDTALVASIAIGIGLIALCWLMAPLFGMVTQQPEAGRMLSWMSIGLLFSAVGAPVVARQRREFEFRTLALRSLVGRLTGSVIGISLAFLGAGVWSLVAQQLLMALFGTVVLWARSTNRPRLRFDYQRLKGLSTFGVFSVAGLFVNFATKRTFVFFAGIFLGTAAAGFVNIAFRTIDTFWSVSATALSQVVLPMMSKLQTDLPRLRRAYAQSVSLACSVLYALFVGLAMTAPEVIEVLFGAKWLQATPYVAALGLLVLLQAPRLFVTPILTAVGRPKLVMAGYLTGLVWLLMAIFATRLSSPGIAIGVWVSSELVYAPLFATLLHRTVGIRYVDQLRQIRAPLLAAMAMAAAVWLLRMTLPAGLPAVARLALLVPVGALAFFATLGVVGRDVLRELATFVMVPLRRKRSPST